MVLYELVFPGFGVCRLGVESQDLWFTQFVCIDREFSNLGDSSPESFWCKWFGFMDLEDMACVTGVQ